MMIKPTSGRRKAAVSVGFLALLALGGVLWQWNRPHEDYSSLEEQARISATELVAACQSGQADHWSEQVLRVNGTLRDTSNGLWILAPGVAIRMRETDQKMEVGLGQEISIKARYLACDDLLGEVRMDFGTMR